MVAYNYLFFDNVFKCKVLLVIFIKMGLVEALEIVAPPSPGCIDANFSTTSRRMKLHQAIRNTSRKKCLLARIGRKLVQLA